MHVLYCSPSSIICSSGKDNHLSCYVLIYILTLSSLTVGRGENHLEIERTQILEAASETTLPTVQGGSCLCPLSPIAPLLAVTFTYHWPSFPHLLSLQMSLIHYLFAILISWDTSKLDPRPFPSPKLALEEIIGERRAKEATQVDENTFCPCSFTQHLETPWM